MRTFAVVFAAAVAVSAFPAAALASPDTCQAEPCTDPIGHFTKPLAPIIGEDPLELRP
jgi:hypothetical protein